MTDLYIGLMSGTSMDGVDAALCELQGTRFARVRALHTRSYDPPLRKDLLRLSRETTALTLEHIAKLDHAVAETFARTATELLRRAKVPAARIRALGSHGQTVFHDPRGVKSSLQLGDPSLIAARTGLTVVADFRRADIARGGQGAPLVPAFHHAVMASAKESRCVLNLGGIANITVLPGLAAAKVRGFDTGPGNGLMDEWSEHQRGQAMDTGGKWAASGVLIPGLLDVLLADPYFAAKPPKSTGRGYFKLDWARQRYAGLGTAAPADVQRTLCELTARSVADAIARHARGTKKILACGGGTANDFLLERLRTLTRAQVESTQSLGLAPQAVEAAAFAWLAMRTLKGLPGNLPAVTGAKHAAVLGGIYRG